MTKVTYDEDLDLRLRGVCERDMDLMLLEELTSSPHFAAAFLDEVGVVLPAIILGVARSVTTSNGESDLELLVRSETDTWKVLIENKVDARYQPRQAERYRERAEQYRKAGTCTQARTVLVAPSAYIGDEASFDVCISYEALREWLEQDPSPDYRTKYKQALISAALSRKEAGWTLVPDPSMTDLWFRYWQLASELAPELNMERPEDKPAGSTTVVFRPAIASQDVQLNHKLVLGRVDLQFRRQRPRAAAFMRRYEGKLTESMHIASAGQSMAVRISVPRISLEMNAFECEQAIRQAIAAAQNLTSWYRRVSR